jgi:integrase
LGNGASGTSARETSRASGSTYVLRTLKGIDRVSAISLHSVNHYHASLKAIISWAKKKRLYFGENPAWGVEMAKVPTARVRFLYPVEEKRLTPVVARMTRLWPYYVIALHTGMRLGEISAIRVQDIVLHPQPAIFVPNSKTKRSRYVPLHGLALEVVMQRLKGREDRPDMRLLEAVHQTTVSLWFNDACREANVADFSFHCLRHTFAGHMLGKGTAIYIVAKMLGHSTVLVTESHYGHLDRSVLSREIHHIDSVMTLPKVPGIDGLESAEAVNKPSVSSSDEASNRA